MAENRSQRGIPLPGLWPACVLVAAIAGTWIMWSEFRRRHETPAIGSAKPDPGEKLRSVLELSRHGESALAELTPLLRSDDHATRRNALLALGQMGSEAGDAMVEVRERFSDEDARVRTEALAAFSRICDDQDQVLMAAAAFLADSDRQVRDVAARTLQTAGPTAIPALIAVAHSESREARQLVIRLLPAADRHRDADEVNAVLRSLFDDPDGTVRLQAIKAVVGRGAARLDEVLGWLRDEDPILVTEGLRAVRSLGPETAAVVIPDLAVLLEERSGLKFRELLPAISQFKAAAAPLIPALLQRGADPNSDARFQIAGTLLAIGADPADIVPILIVLLDSDKAHYNDCWQAGQLLTQIDPAEARRQVSRLVSKIEAKETEPMEHEDADLQSLCGMGSQAQEAVPLLIRLLSHPSRSVRGIAMATICGLGPAAAPAVPMLLPLADRESHAIMALGRIGSDARSAVPKLLKLSDNPHSGEYAARALGQIGDASPQVIAALRRQLTRTPEQNNQHQDLARLRVAAIQSLVLLAGDRATTLADLLSLLIDSDQAVRVEAIAGIGRLTGDRGEAIERLIESLDDVAPAIQTAAARALGRIGPQAQAALPELRRLAADRRSVLARSWQHWPDENSQRYVSLAEAAQWAISAIEPPAP